MVDKCFGNKLRSLYAKFQPSSFQTEGGERGDVRTHTDDVLEKIELHCFFLTHQLALLARGDKNLFIPI